MKKAIEDSKWYWYMPLLWLYFVPTMAKWALSAEKEIDRGWRFILIEFLMFPTIICVFSIFFYLFPQK